MKQLKKGSRGSDVKTLQTALGLTVDGVFGPLTEKAVERFQLDKDLMVTGVVDSDMWVLVLNMEYTIDEAIDEDTDSTSQYFTTKFDQVIHRHYLPKGEYIKGPIKNNYIFYIIQQEIQIHTDVLIIGEEIQEVELQLNLF